MQETADDGRRGGDFLVYQQAPRLLESADGGTWEFGIELNRGGRKVLAVAENVRTEPFCLQLEAGTLRGVAYRIDKLFWSHTYALLFSEGGPIQTLIGPGYLFLDGRRASAYDPRPHLRDVLLAAIEGAPAGMGLLDAFSRLRSELC